MYKKILFFLFFLLLASCKLSEVSDNSSPGAQNFFLNKFFSSSDEKETGSKSVTYGYLKTESKVFSVKSMDVKKIDNIDVSAYKHRLPSQMPDPTFDNGKNDKLSSIKLSLKEGSVLRNDETGLFSYQVLLEKGDKKDDLYVGYALQSKKTYKQGITFSITADDVKNVDNIKGDITKFPTDSSVPSSPVFSTLSKKGIQFKIKLLKFANGDGVRRDDKTGKYEYKVKVSLDTDASAYKDLVVSYKFKSKLELSPQDKIEEELFNSIAESDIKLKDGLTFALDDKPESKGTPNFNISGYNIKSLNSVSIKLDDGSLQKNNAGGSYSYRVNLKYTLVSERKTLNKSIQVTYLVNAPIGAITENDIKAVDGISVSSLTLPSELSNPPVFDTSKGVGGLSGVSFSVNSVSADDAAGSYEYEVQASKAGRSKTLLVKYTGFETSSDRKKRTDLETLYSVTSADAKSIDGINVDPNALPSTFVTPTFGNKIKGVSDVHITATNAVKNDATGTYTYVLNMRKYGQTVKVVVSYAGFQNVLQAAQARDLRRLHSFTEADVKAMDDITLSTENMAPDKDPSWTKKAKHGFASNGYTMTLIAGSRNTDKNKGIYSYRVRLSSVGTNQNRDLSIIYRGFLTYAKKLARDTKNIEKFVASDIKLWDGVTLSSSTYASNLPDKPTFTLPSTYKGLSNFKVIFSGASATKNDDLGTYQYEVTLKNDNEVLSKTIIVAYRGFNRGFIVFPPSSGLNVFLLHSNTNKLFAKGLNRKGELGLGDQKKRTSFTEVTNPAIQGKVRKVVYNSRISFIITTDNRLFVAGENRWGVLGLPGFSQRRGSVKTVHTEIQDPAIKGKVKDVYMHPSDYLAYIVTTDNKLFATGDIWGARGYKLQASTTHPDYPSEMTNPKITGKVKELKLVSDTNDLAIATTDNKLWFSVSNNPDKFLGIGDVSQVKNDLVAPTVAGISGKVKDMIIPSQSNKDSLFIVTTDKRVFASGSNENGQLGLGDKTDRNVSTEIIHPDISGKVKQIASGGVDGRLTAILTTEDRLFISGDNIEFRWKSRTYIGSKDYYFKSYNSPVEVLNLPNCSLCDPKFNGINKLQKNVKQIFLTGRSHRGYILTKDNLLFNDGYQLSSTSTDETGGFKPISGKIIRIMGQSSNIYIATTGNGEDFYEVTNQGTKVTPVNVPTD